MITLPPPYHIIKTTLDMDMNAKQRRQAKRRNDFLLRKAQRDVAEIDEQAMNAQRIEADPELTTNKTAWFIACGLLLSLIVGVIAAWS